jgi:hypothetical protein
MREMEGGGDALRPGLAVFAREGQKIKILNFPLDIVLGKI